MRDELHFEGEIRDETATRDFDLVTCRTQKSTNEQLYLFLDGTWYFSSREFQH